MAAQITGDPIKHISLSPLRQLHLLDKIETTPPVSAVLQNWELPANSEPVGTKDFIFYPRCSNWKLVTAPTNFHMFIITKPNSLMNIVLIDHDFLRTMAESLSHVPSAEKPHRLADTWAISNRLAMFYQEAVSDLPGRAILLRNLAQVITTMLLQSISISPSLAPAKRKFKDMKPVIDYLENNYHKQISLKELAIQVNYSQYYFIRLFKKETGMSPFDYLAQIRLVKSKEFLSRTNMSITEICLQCGFQNSSHFSNFFKHHTGQCPSEYRQQNQSSQIASS